MRTVGIAFLLLMTFSYSVKAQDYANIKPYAAELIPPSPEAASLGKFIDVPVNLYAGLPNIRVPLYTLKGRDLSIPIAIKYHASGLKVEEISSSIGAGWTLEASGMLSRTVRGLPDEHSNGYFSDQAPFNPITGDPDLLHTNCDETTEGNRFYDRMERMAEGCTDTEPDVFFFSAPGLSGRFLFDRNKNAYFLPHAKTKIDIHPFDGLSAMPTSFKGGWELLDEAGNRYYFGRYITYTSSTTEGELIADRTVTSATSCDAALSGCSTIDAYSSWKLTKIVSASGRDVVTFHYQPELISYTSATPVNEYITVYGSNDGPMAPVTGGCDRLITVYEYKLKSIETSWNERVEFNVDLTLERKDLKGSKRLQEVVILNSNVPIKRYKLSHSYFSANPSSTLKEDFTLRLDNIQEYCGDGSKSLPAYKFMYKGNFRPSRKSKDQDHWGFYNNSGLRMVNKTLMPETTFRHAVFNGTVDVKGGNREANEEAAKSGILEKIIYPTGGSTKFEYELHDYVKNYNNMIYEEFELVNFSLTYNSSNTNAVEQTFFVNEPLEVRIFSSTPCGVYGNPFCYMKIYEDGALFQDISIQNDGYGKRLLLQPGKVYKIRARMRNYNCPDWSCAMDEVQEEGIPSDVPHSGDFTGESMFARLVYEKEKVTTGPVVKKGGGFELRKLSLMMHIIL